MVQIIITMTILMKKIVLAVLILATATGIAAAQNNGRWSEQKAREWYNRFGWLRGSNFIVHTAVNQLEMWQAETFDTLGIDQDLAFAQSIGMNCMRVFLHHAAWQENPEGFKARMNKYLDIASAHGIITLFVFFDDCWNETYHTGKQPEPRPGIHNSGWLRDPGKLWYEEPALRDTLERYEKDILLTFGHDKRILLWDLYNEPGNNKMGDKSMTLLRLAFTWAREVHPDQPLSAGVWNKSLAALNQFQLENSDVITYHNYDPPAAHQQAIDTLLHFGRPLLCTEYMARRNNSLFTNIMPLLKKENIAAINWGLVAGKTNTIYAWDTPMPSGAEPPIWFHDIVRPDGTPFSAEEIKYIKTLTSTSSSSPLP